MRSKAEHVRHGYSYGFLRWYRNLSLLALALVALPFLIQEMRNGLYPQLERPWQQVGAQLGEAAPKRTETLEKRSPASASLAADAVADGEYNEITP